MYMLQGIAPTSKEISGLHIPSFFSKLKLRQAGVAQHVLQYPMLIAQRVDYLKELQSVCR